MDRRRQDLSGRSAPRDQIRRLHGGKRDFKILFEPTPTTSLDSFDWTKNYLVLNVLDDVKNRLYVLAPGSGEWKKEPMPGGPGFAKVSLWGVDEQESDEFFMTVMDFLTPLPSSTEP